MGASHVRSTIILATAFMGLVALAPATDASANPNPTHYTDADVFHALGTIDQVTSFDALFPDAGSMFIDDLFVDGDLSIASLGNNTIVGAGVAPYFAVRNAFANNVDDPIKVLINAPGYDLLSFRVGDLVGSDAVTVDFTLSDGFYGTGVLSWPAQEGFRFHGFQAPEGKYFTSFRLKANTSNGFHRIGLAEIELGRVGAVPEPASWALMILGFGGVGASLRARRRLGAPGGLAS